MDLMSVEQCPTPPAALTPALPLPYTTAPPANTAAAAPPPLSTRSPCPRPLSTPPPTQTLRDPRHSEGHRSRPSVHRAGPPRPTPPFPQPLRPSAAPYIAHTQFRTAPVHNRILHSRAALCCALGSATRCAPSAAGTPHPNPTHHPCAAACCAPAQPHAASIHSCILRPLRSRMPRLCAARRCAHAQPLAAPLRHPTRRPFRCPCAPMRSSAGACWAPAEPHFAPLAQPHAAPTRNCVLQPCARHRCPPPQPHAAL